MRVGLDIVLFIVAVLSGRVIPMFTNNGLPGASAHGNRRLDQLATALILVLLFADAFQARPQVIAAVTLMSALVHAARLVMWQPWKTLQTPLVWILHAGYGWIVIHFLPRNYVATVALSGMLWSVAFCVFAFFYWPILSRARTDGKAG